MTPDEYDALCEARGLIDECWDAIKEAVGCIHDLHGDDGWARYLDTPVMRRIRRTQDQCRYFNDANTLPQKPAPNYDDGTGSPAMLGLAEALEREGLATWCDMAERACSHALPVAHIYRRIAQMLRIATTPNDIPKERERFDRAQ